MVRWLRFLLALLLLLLVLPFWLLCYLTHYLNKGCSWIFTQAEREAQRLLDF